MQNLAKENSNIEITGNENLKEGENIITIIVKGENEAETVTYQIIVNKTNKDANALNNTLNDAEKKANKIRMILLGSVGFIIIFVIIK